MADKQQLVSILQRLDGRGYPAYKDIRGHYTFDTFTLFVDYVQGDPFAAPSRLRVRVPMSVANFPKSACNNRSRSIALRDFLSRKFSEACRRRSDSSRGSGKSGLISMPQPGQQILERSAVVVTSEYIEARFTVGLPARGRRILGQQASRMLTTDISAIVDTALQYKNLDSTRLTRHLNAAEDADSLREQLSPLGLVAFVADGAILPRRSGIDDRPFTGAAVPFSSPASLRVNIVLPHTGSVSGMGIPRGVTLIVGGGYHGKSTLLTALEKGVYNHLPGDGRELVVSRARAVKIRAEDGRRVEGVDIRPFIANLPNGVDSATFSSANASGSTSQAANIMEALEVGTDLLLLDEDTCATNLMIRDARMQTLVEKAGEPITPFIDRVRHLANRDVSSILVLGGSGDYFDVADTVIRMDHYIPSNVTEEAKTIADRQPTGRRVESSEGLWPEMSRRVPIPLSLDPSKGRRAVNIKGRALRAVTFGTEEIDMSAVTQLVDEGQLVAIGLALNVAREQFMNQQSTVTEVVNEVLALIEARGLDSLNRYPVGNLVAFRPYELAAALNRLRTLRVNNIKNADGETGI
jgi:predicted ABC-class ATPase